jgi:hypothetical protein
VTHAQLPDGVLEEMPEQVRAVLAGAREVEFATLSAGGVPVNNPLFHYFGPAGTTNDVATGVAYPAKADRARRNPKVGLLFAPGIAAADPVVKGSLTGQVSLEGTPGGAPPDSPVVVICATASVRDADIQANTDRYHSWRRMLGPLPSARPLSPGRSLPPRAARRSARRAFHGSVR